MIYRKNEIGLVNVVMGNKRIYGGKYDYYGQPLYYAIIWRGKKKFEVRHDDRDKVPLILEDQYKYTPRYETNIKPIMEKFKMQWAEKSKLSRESLLYP